MLAVMIALGAVGGALAVKAKKFGNGTYCTTSQGQIGQSSCPVLLRFVSFAPGGTILYRKVPEGTSNCANTICTSIGRPNG